MGYLVAQLRKQSGMVYMDNTIQGQYEPIVISSPNTFGSQTDTFTDLALQLRNGYKFEAKKVYYLRFRIHKIPQYFYSGSKSLGQVANYQNDADSLRLKIILKNSGENDETTVPPEVIGTCTVPQTTYDKPSEYAVYSFVFCPSKDFDVLGFRINRVSYDAVYAHTTGNQIKYRTWLTDQIDLSNPDVTKDVYISATSQDKVPVTTEGARFYCDDLCLLNNLVDASQSSIGWLKFGYQSRPGSLIVVNGEPIRVGRSGIYQINNGTLITSFMIASPGGSDVSKIDAFLLDYAYQIDTQ